MENSDSQLIYEQYRAITGQDPLLRPPPPPRPRAEWRRVNAAGHDDEPVIDEDGNKFWYNDRGEPHREDGPAIERADGSKVWRINGKLHREDGPAIEYAFGGADWYINNKLHREDGPAIERADGTKVWYINGNHYKSTREWAAALFEYKGWTREALKNTGRDYNTLLNTVIKMMKNKYGK